MSVTTHERPGVYSSYDASSAVTGRGGNKPVGLAGVNTKVQAGRIYTVTSFDQALSLFGDDGPEGMAQLIRLALLNGAAAVLAAPAASQEGYEAALSLLEDTETAVVLCASTDSAVQQKLRDSVQRASAARRERIALAAGAKNESVEQLIARAAQLNHERVVLVGPGASDTQGTALSGLPLAAAAAGAVAALSDPALPLGGAVLHGLSGLSARYSDSDVDLLVRGGVTPVESVAGEVSVIRGITTRTTTGGSADRTWRELSTVLVVDDVIPAVRAALRRKFHRAKNTPQSRGAIRSQVVVELENKLAQEIISGYDHVAVTQKEDDPTVCVVDFSFTVAHSLNQIWLTAHITV